MTAISNVIGRWTNVRGRLLETIDKFAPSELDFRPFPSSWTVRRLTLAPRFRAQRASAGVLHIAHEENGEFNYGLTQTLPDFPPEYDPANYPDLAALKALLAEVHQSSLAHLATLADPDLERVIHTPWGADYRLASMVEHLIEHEIHHRAELSLILGMLGKQGLNA